MSDSRISDADLDKILKVNDLEWLLDPDYDAKVQAAHDAKMEALYGPRCPRCGYRINDPMINYPHLPWCKPGKHDCYTGDEMAR